ncbi:MAG: CHAT domain-containing protein [Candidatus Eremiobacterota bacterium]
MRRWVPFLLVLTLWLPATGQPSDELSRNSMAQIMKYFRMGELEATRKLFGFVENLTPPGTLPHGADLALGPMAVLPLALDYRSGRYSQVIAKGRTAAQLAREGGRPDRERALRLLVVAAARRNGQPSLVREQLPRLEELTRTPATSSERLARFSVLSFQWEAGSQLSAPDRAAWLKAHEEAYAVVADFERDEDFLRNSVMEAWIACEAMQVWFSGSMELLNQAERDRIGKLDARLVLRMLQMPQLPQDMEVLEAERRTNFQPPLAVMLVIAQSARQYRLGGEEGLRLSRAFLTAYLRVALKYQSDFEQLQELAMRPEGGLAFVQAGIVDFRRTDAARVAARFQLEMARQVLDEHRLRGGEFTPEQLEELQTGLSEAQRYLALCPDPALSLDLSLARAEAVFVLRPAGWEAQVEEILHAEQTRLEGLNFRPGLIEVYSAQGRLRAAQNRKAAAIEALNRAVTLLEAYVQEVGGGPLAAARIRRDSKPVYELLARLYLETGDNLAAADVLDRLGQVQTAAGLRLRDRSESDPETRKAVQAATEAQIGTGALESQLTRDSRLLADNKTAYYQAVAEIQQREPAYRRLSIRPNNFSRVQQSLPEDTVLVQVFPCDTRLVLFVATRDSLRVRQVDVPAARIDLSVQNFRTQVARFQRSKQASDGTLEACRELGAWLWTPLQEDLKGKSVVAFIPTGSLLYFPFAALARGPHYLVESHAVVTLVKASDLDLDAPERGGSQLFALGDPDGSLGGARREVEQLSRSFPEARVWLGPEATRERLDEAAGHRFVHLATHGVLDSLQPTQSYLVLAPSPRGEGRISVAELAGLNLKGVELVSLSACQTALAERSPEVGSDLTSLADAVGFAGSPSVMASLWKVSDESTAGLMLEFYVGLREERSKAESLRQAQLKLLNRPDTAHPYHWASFVLFGDWR